MKKFISIIQDVRLYQYTSALIISYFLFHIFKALLS